MPSETCRCSAATNGMNIRPLIHRIARVVGAAIVALSLLAAGCGGKGGGQEGTNTGTSGDKPTFEFVRAEGTNPNYTLFITGKCPDGSRPTNVTMLSPFGTNKLPVSPVGKSGNEMSFSAHLGGIDNVAAFDDPTIREQILDEIGFPEHVEGTCK